MRKEKHNPDGAASKIFRGIDLPSDFWKGSGVYLRVLLV